MSYVYRPQGKIMFSQASVILFTIGLVPTRSLLFLVGYSVTALPRWLLGHLLWCGWYASYWNTSLFNLFLQVLGSVAFLFHPGPLDIRELFTNSLNSLHLFKPPSICLYYGTGTTMQSLQESIPVVSVLPACPPRSNEQV